MKKVYFLIGTLCIYLSSMAQTVVLPGGDMENWRSSMAGISSPVAIEAPYNWYGADSLFIGLGQSIGHIVLGTPDSVWRRQLFKDSNAHTGTYSARLMTTYQDTVLFPGVLSNAKIHVNITYSPPGISGISYTGGAAVMLKPTSVSAWVQYFPGKDTLGVTGPDTAFLSVQALSHISGYDSVIGTGVVQIPPCTSWTQITANVVYALDTTDFVDTLRVTFSSSGGGATVPLDSSVLYVDDVTMTGVAQISHTAVGAIATGSSVKLYPNPASGTLYISSPENAGYSCSVMDLNGRVLLRKVLTGTDIIDVASMPGGMYFYVVTGSDGNTVARGKFSVVN